MPSLEGDEIDIAIEKGFLEQNLHVVDKNPAIVATLKKRYPRLNTYGVDIAKAFYRLRERGLLMSVCNLDLTGPACSGSMRSQLLTVGFRLSPVARIAIAVTWLKGRDVPRYFNWAKTRAMAAQSSGTISHRFSELPENDLARVCAITDALSHHVYVKSLGRWEPTRQIKAPYVTRYGEYSSGISTMMWAVFDRHAINCMCDHCRHQYELVSGDLLTKETLDDALSEEAVRAWAINPFAVMQENKGVRF